MTVKLTSSKIMVEKEPEKVLKELPRMYVPIACLSILLDHMLGRILWCTNLKMIDTLTQSPLSSLQRLSIPSPLRLPAQKNFFASEGR